MTWFDYVVIAVLGVSVLLALYRGAVREITALAGWAAALILSGLFAQELAQPVPGPEQQQGRNAYLESEVATLDKQIAEIKKLKELTVALLQRKKVVESLQANRAETVYLLDQLVRQLPDGVYLKSIQQKGHQVNITGYAQSNARVSTFMRNLEASPYLEKPSLIEIKAVTERNARLSEFGLAVFLARTKDETAGRKPGAKPAAAAPGAAGAIPSAQVLAPAMTAGATPATNASSRSGLH